MSEDEKKGGGGVSSGGGDPPPPPPQFYGTFQAVTMIMVTKLFLVIQDQDLRERHLGDLHGHVYRELAKVSPMTYQAFVSRMIKKSLYYRYCLTLALTTKT